MKVNTLKPYILIKFKSESQDRSILMAYSIMHTTKERNILLATNDYNRLKYAIPCAEFDLPIAVNSDTFKYLCDNFSKNFLKYLPYLSLDKFLDRLISKKMNAGNILLLSVIIDYIIRTTKFRVSIKDYIKDFKFKLYTTY